MKLVIENWNWIEKNESGYSKLKLDRKPEIGYRKLKLDRKTETKLDTVEKVNSKFICEK